MLVEILIKKTEIDKKVIFVENEKPGALALKKLYLWQQTFTKSHQVTDNKLSSRLIIPKITPAHGC